MSGWSSSTTLAGHVAVSAASEAALEGDEDVGSAMRPSMKSIHDCSKGASSCSAPMSAMASLKNAKPHAPRINRLLTRVVFFHASIAKSKSPVLILLSNDFDVWDACLDVTVLNEHLYYYRAPHLR